MTNPSDVVFEAMRLPDTSIQPRPALESELRARLHQRLGLEPPVGVAPLPRRVGLEYEVGGDEDGDVVLFMHAGTATAFVPMMHEPALADRYGLLRYHRRGFAGSDALDGEPSIAIHVQDALALLEALRVEKAHVVAHSGSGVIALQLAIEAPAVVKSLVLEEPAIYSIDAQWAERVRQNIAAPLARCRSGDPRGAMEMWMDWIAHSWRADLMRTVPCGPQQTLDDAAAFFGDVTAVDNWEFDRRRIETLTQPVLYVVAAGSRTRAVAQRFREVVPQTEFAVIPAASHMLHTDQPELVAAELNDFFERHSGAF